MKSGHCANDDLEAVGPTAWESDIGVGSNRRVGKVALLQGPINEFAIDGQASAAADAMA